MSDDAESVADAGSTTPESPGAAASSQSASTPPRYRLPSRPPSATDIDDQERFHKLSSASLSEVRSSAEKWRTGLAALVTLITGGLLIKGPSSASDLTTGWRLAISLLAGGGIAVSILGLWQALEASAGLPKKVQFNEIIADNESVLAWELVQADKAAGKLKHAREALMLALPLLAAAIIVWWWAPTKPSSPPAYVSVERNSKPSPICGTLKSGDNAHLIIQVAGNEKPTVIPYTDVTNMRVTASC